ncbi:MAG: alpha/beta hydrolase [Burkholderiaceae bacterium]|jgi:pimeloyl-ACP methyl ester carboxylesterase|nr:alpha/beta hydrolase [Burkholderiaceae bacterium]
MADPARVIRALAACAALAAAAGAAAAAGEPCRLKGIDRELQCGKVSVAEDPDRPDGRRIEVHYAVVPALARVRSLEPVFVFAGGPGQSARRAAGQVQPLFARLNARRDIVYVDQRGTGLSNPLSCASERGPAASLADSLDAEALAARTRDCLRRLGAASDLRQYATWIAVRDVDAVRAALGHPRINLWGASYGTRAALEYLRQYPQHVRSVVLDGMAPADMALPASFAVDAQASLERLLAACAADRACNDRYPRLEAAIDGVLARAGAGPKSTVSHPLTGQPEDLRLMPATLASALRVPLYSPPLAALLPYALGEASRDNLTPLLTIAASLTSGVAENFAEGMHFAVVCAEDLPRLDAAARSAAAATRFGGTFLNVYDDACAAVPSREVPAAFYRFSDADVPVLILSGGADPATPPRHGQRVARALKRATHVVAPNLAHGVSLHGCAPELVAGFIRGAGAEGLDLGCLDRLPPPKFFAPPTGEGGRR